MRFDILVTNSTILPLGPTMPEIIEYGFIAVRAGKIVDLGPMADLADTYRADITIDGNGHLAMPGLVNTHTHAPMTLFRGLADDLPLMTWLNDYIFPAEARSVNPEMVYWCSKLAAAEMMLSGTTTAADGYFLEDSVAEAFIAAGLRSVPAQGIIDFPAPGVPDPGKNVANAGSFIERWQGKNPLLTPALFCHSPYTCSPDTLQKAKEVARARDAKFFIHLAETRVEVEQLLEKQGKTPVRHLESLDLLDRNTICVHCVWLEKDEIDTLARYGVKVATCPQSNMKLGSGMAPLREMLAAGINVGLGTDGCASNNTLDMFREMDVCAKLHKVKALDPAVMPAATVLEMATRGGADVLGLGDKVGSLVPGKAADIILLDLRRPHLQPFYNPDLLVYAAGGADVATVIIAGKLIMEDRKILTFDVDEAMTKVRELAENV
ncbi:MAG: amidohydrolase [Desulfobulbales bacterium]|nr:amidohydrolase [Desulfobulbales bacterium]